MNCFACERKENILYENDNMIIMIPEKPSTSGHLQIFPKRHVTIMEQLSDEEANYLIKAANTISMILFETLKVHGTNILIQNGVSSGQIIPHFSINIIPRRTDDGLSLEWDMKKASEESLESTKQMISDNIVYEQDSFDKDSKAYKEEHTKEENINNTTNSKENDDSNLKEKNSKEKHSDTNDKKNLSNEIKITNFWLKSFERIP